MENNVYTFADGTLIGLNLLDNSIKNIDTINRKYFVHSVYYIEKPGTLVIKKDNIFAEDTTLNLNEGSLLFLVKDLSVHKDNWGYYCKAIVIDNKELLEMFTKNLAIEQKEQEEAKKKEAKAEACIECDNCESCC